MPTHVENRITAALAKEADERDRPGIGERRERAIADAQPVIPSPKR